MGMWLVEEGGGVGGGALVAGILEGDEGRERNCREKIERGERKWDFGSF